jgi:MinD superfamily P-loop ATPase
MKKPSKTTLRNKLDRICSEIVRGRGKCERCSNKETLQCCHVYSRTYNNTRWLLDNLLCLCASCHFWSHKNPLEFAEVVKGKIGEEKYDELRESRNQITKYTTEDLQIKYNVLKQLLEGQINDSIK